MTAAAKNTFGVTLKIGTAGGALSAVAELTNVTPPAWSRDAIDATTHDSPSGAAEYIPDGVYDPGEIKLEGNLISGSTDDDRLVAAIAAGTLLDWEIEIKAASGTKTMSGSDAFLTDYTYGDMPVKGGKQTFTATLRCNGPITVEA
jgi:hypothetical protein